MTMPDLPPDLVEEILSRVPTTSVKKLRSTCTQWNAIFKDERFTEKHFSKAPKESMVLMLKEHRVCPDNRLLVWNPCLGETKWIQLKVDYRRYVSKFCLGYIQNNESRRSYKILRSWYSYDDKSSPRQRDLGFEIYEFISDSSWRVLNDGNTYLLAYDVEENSRVLLMFDFTTERFKRLRLPHFQDVGNMDLSVVREEQLSILHWTRNTSKMEIWITNNIDTDATLLWRLHLHTQVFSRNCVRVFSSLYIDKEKKVVLCCNVNDDATSKNIVYIIGEDNGYYTEIPFLLPINIHWVLLDRNKKWYSSIFNYVPRLVQIYNGHLLFFS
ncbi:unnamed protein product [Arabidopsis thaliana]|uniref:F-box domain-containing protein n=1 Tax=Arabidopsis thaliana TaxID=3702 RepID=A0A5S9XEP3_ARATH|nr:unnamed protein product [Arabidopsis thaliana]